MRIQFALIMSFSAFWMVETSSLSAQESVEEIRQSMATLGSALAADTTLSPQDKQDATARLQTVDAHLKKIETFRERVVTEEKAIQTVNERLEQIQQTIDRLKSSSTQKTDQAMTLEDIDALVTNKQQAVKKLQQEIQQNDLEAARRINRRQEIRKALEDNENNKNNVQIAFRALPPNDTGIPGKAKKLEAIATLRMLDSEQSALRAEQARYDAEKNVEFLRTQKESFTLQLESSQTYLAALESLQSQKRQAQAREVAEKAKQAEQSNQSPLLAESYQLNTAIALRTQTLESRASSIKDQLDATRNKYGELSDKYRESRMRVNSIGLTGSIGVMLRKRKAEIPQYSVGGMSVDEIRSEIDEVQFELFEVNQQLDELSRATIIEEIKTVNNGRTPSGLEKLDQEIAELISAREEKLTAASSGLDRLFEALLDLEFDRRSLTKLTAEFRDYVNERILWIRSNKILFTEFSIDEGDKPIFRSRSWVDAGNKAWQMFRKNPLMFGLLGIICVVGVLRKRVLLKEIDALGDEADRGTCDSFWPTTRATILTLLVAIPIPLIPLILGIGMVNFAGPDDTFFYALGAALVAGGGFAIPVEYLRRMCRPNGLASKHFDWSEYAVVRFRRNLRWINIPGALLAFLITFFREVDSGHNVDLIERSMFVVGMVLLTLFLYRVFHPKSGMFSHFLSANKASWANQTSPVWFGLILLVPASLLLLTIFGYYFTAANLAECAFWTLVLGVIAELIRGMLNRLILIRRRRVRLATLRQRREQRRKRKNAENQKLDSSVKESKLSLEESNPPPSETTSQLLAATAKPQEPTAAAPDVEIDEIAFQANKFVSLLTVMVWGTGLWLIWADVLPALKALDNYRLWSTGTAVATESTSSSSTSMPGVPQSPSTESGESSQEKARPSSSDLDSNANTFPNEEAAKKPGDDYVTVRDLLGFLLILIVTIVSAMRLPSAVEMLFPEDLPLDRSFRYAIKALVSYVIIIIGVILAFRALSISWTNVQWLATALTFGLAFGLQEIFANFVAGLILMLERPIRIGDWVTVDDFTGVVTKIQTRATTIVNFDRKEYVIPNKDFITGRLVNWTLSDPINRISFTVGVAYGSDIKKAKELLYEICANHPRTIEDPPTLIAFEEFGDSALNLVVRTFIRDIDLRPRIIDDLHTQINDSFNANGIEIAFPQRDLHLRSVDREAADVISAMANEEKSQTK